MLSSRKKLISNNSSLYYNYKIISLCLFKIRLIAPFYIIYILFAILSVPTC